MILYIAFLIITLIYFLFIYISWNENYWIKQKIPFIEPEKLFGNVKDVVFMKRTIGEVYQDIYRQLTGKPLGGFFKMRQPILMIRDPDLVTDVLLKKFNCFHDNDISIRRDADPILKTNPMFAKGSTWESNRAVLVPLQQNELLEGLLHTIKANCGNMICYLKSQERAIEVKELSSKYTSDVMASCALGSDANSFVKPDDKFMSMAQKLIKKDIKSNAAVLCALYAPILGNWLNFRILSSEVCTYFINLVSRECQYRVQEGVRKKDFLQRLIDINKESEASGEGTAYKYDQITGHCMSIFLAGYKMTSHPLSFCLYEIAKNPEIQKRLKTEIQTSGIKNIDALSNYLLHGLEYLDMVVNESLRLHPPMETITRICTVDTELSHNGLSYPVAKGTPVTIPVRALHTDPDFYSNPLEFNPERFNPGKFKKRHPSIYLPFGAGPRECPGSKFAKLTLKTAIVSILLNFEVVLRGTIKELENEPMSSLLTEPRGTIWLRFKKKVEFY